MEKKISIQNILIVVLTLLCAFLLFGRKTCPIAKFQKQDQLPRTINVSAQTKIKTKPNLAIVQMGVEALSPRLSTAINQANSKMNSLMEKLKTFGIDEKDIQSNISSYPQQDYSDGKAKIIGYQVNNSITVNIHQLDQVSSVIDAALDLGINNISNITWTMDEFSSPRSQAREMASKKVLEKAEEIAKASGVKLGRLLTISENNSRPFLNAYNQSLVRDAAFEERKKSSEIGAAVSAGSLDVSVEIDAVFEIED